MPNLSVKSLGRDKPADRGMHVLFIHGLGGDDVGTWTHERTKFFWPRELAEDLAERSIHVWTLAYPAEATRWTRSPGHGQALPARARSVLDLLASNGFKDRQLAVVAHSLGGLLAKQMLRVSGDFGARQFEWFARNLCGVAFLATPHAGSSMANLASYFKLARGTALLADLQSHDEDLRDLNDWYRNYAPRRQLQTIAYVETLTVAGGIMVVDRTSADPHVPDVLAIDVDADHFEICKPDGPESPVYAGIRRFLIEDLPTTRVEPESQSTKPAGAPITLEFETLSNARQFWESKLWLAQTDSGAFNTQAFEGYGMPQTWTTAQAISALLFTPGCHRERERLLRAFEFIEHDRSLSGTDGWTYVTESGEDGVTEIAAWVTVAHTLGLRSGVFPDNADIIKDLRVRIERDINYLLSRQFKSGGFSAISHVSRENCRTYQTACALWALSAAHSLGIWDNLEAPIQRAMRWLEQSYLSDFGWPPNPSRPKQREKFLGLNAFVLAVLYEVAVEFAESRSGRMMLSNPAFKRARSAFLAEGALESRRFEQNDRVDDIDQFVEGSKMRLEGTTFLWCPWAALVLHRMSGDRKLPGAERERAEGLAWKLIGQIAQAEEQVGVGGTWEVAETLYCLTLIEESIG